MTVLLSWLFLGNKASFGVLQSVVVVCVGFVIGAMSKLTVATLDLGLVMGVLSTFTTALETIIVKRYAPKLSLLRAVYITSLFGFATFALLAVISGEVDEFATIVHDSKLAAYFGLPPSVVGSGPSFNVIVGSIIVSGTAYYLVSLAAVLQITVTSPVTHTISTAVRGVLQTLLAVLLLPNEGLTGSQVVSIFFILAGSAAYTWVKEQQRKG